MCYWKCWISRKKGDSLHMHDRIMWMKFRSTAIEKHLRHSIENKIVLNTRAPTLFSYASSFSSFSSLVHHYCGSSLYRCEYTVCTVVPTVCRYVESFSPNSLAIFPVHSILDQAHHCKTSHSLFDNIMHQSVLWVPFRCRKYIQCSFMCVA